ncbi:MAG TPA: S8 family serine peptidase [Actinomycetota bacterium]|nr:S8 family serine peptidase [Actinomycetota bacterium]
MLKQVVSLVAALLTGATLSAGPATARDTAPGVPDTYRSSQWGLDKIGAPAAWEVSDGTGALIAVVDTGVDLDHPDLVDKLVVYPDADFVEPKGICTGRPPRRTCVQDGPQDRNGHGTHVAGIIGAAADNGIGIAGIARGASLMPVRVLDRGGNGNTEEVGAGVRFAADKGATVINLSLAFDPGPGEVNRILGRMGPLYSAIDYAVDKGAVVVIAAGNASVPVCAEPSAHPRAICVGATDVRDLRTFYSNSDADPSQPFMVAPGGDGLTCNGDIVSTYLRSAKGSACSPEAGFDFDSGTSMAAPHVSGTAGLLAATGLAGPDIFDCLLATAEDLGAPGWDSIYGAGRVDADNALATCI